MERTTTKEARPCTFCAKMTQRGVRQSAEPPAESGPITPLCVECLKQLRRVDARDDHLEADALTCEHWNDKYERDCANQAVYQLYHEGYNSSDRYAHVCANQAHIAFFSEKHEDDAKKIPYLDDTAPEPHTDVKNGQVRRSDADEFIRVVRTGKHLARAYFVNKYGRAEGERASLPWLPLEEIVRRWPIITEGS
jgi:hypothetical protein